MPPKAKKPRKPRAKRSDAAPAASAKMKRSDVQKYGVVSHGLGSVFKTSNPFPLRKYGKHVYTDTFTFTTGAAGVFGTEQIFRVNSLFDPDFTGTGHQPYGRDTMATLYAKYKVMGVSYRVVYTNPSVDGIVVGMLVGGPSDPSVLAGISIAVAAEKQNIRVAPVNNTGSQVAEFTGYIDCAKLSGLTKHEYRADTITYAAATGANPALTPTIRLSAADIIATGGLTIQCLVSLNFYVQWFDRLQLGQS